MNNKTLYLLAGLSAAILLAGCSDSNTSIELPKPVAMTEEALGHYCNMNILEHDGPKAQIHLENITHPIWFSQVRDAIAYTRLPEETFKARVIYVHDMSKAESWADPGDEAWLDIDDAFFVIESTIIGSMGAPETIPFGTREAAMAFASKKGGTVVTLEEIPDQYVLGPVEISNQSTGSLK